MKKHITLLAFILISTFAKASLVEDSLIANIGKKAKVIFYAEKKEDLNEIAKYDLNKLFAEVRKRSEKNFTNNEEVTLREVDENLKNRETNTTVTPKKWFRNMNLNLFVGGSNILQGKYDYNTFIGNYRDIILPNNEKRQFGDVSIVKPSGGFILGLGIFKEKTVKEKKRFRTSIKYGYGLEFMTHKTKLVNSYIFYKYPDKNFDALTNNFIDSLETSQTLRRTFSSFNNAFDNLPNTNLYFQFMPYFHFTNKKRQNNFNIGIGVRFGLSLNAFGKMVQSEYYSIKSKYKSPFGYYPANRIYHTMFSSPLDIPFLTYKYKPIQSSVIFNVGYKYINFFYNINLSNLVIMGSSLIVIDRDDNWNSSTGFYGNFTRNTHSFGLRFGK